MKIEPYLMFNGRADEAIEFYKKALGAEVVMVTRFKDSPEPAMVPPGSENKVMHASLRVGPMELMLSDGECTGTANFAGINLSLSVDGEAQADRVFGALAEGGKVTLPLTRTFFSPKFGMVSDRFGVSWMVIVPQDQRS
jgi:PhnB protein